MDLSLLPKGRYEARKCKIILKYNHRSLTKPFALEIRSAKEGTESTFVGSVMTFVDLNALQPDPRCKDDVIKRLRTHTAATILYETTTSYVTDGDKVKPYTKVLIPRYIILSKDIVFVNVR
jgi:hypothetical protein